MMVAIRHFKTQILNHRCPAALPKENHMSGIYIYIIISYYIISYYNILYYSIVYYIILCYIILYYMILCYIILYYVILYYSVYTIYIYTIYIYIHIHTIPNLWQNQQERGAPILYIYSFPM